jgi:hypothetical protein
VFHGSGGGGGNNSNKKKNKKRSVDETRRTRTIEGPDGFGDQIWT